MRLVATLQSPLVVVLPRKTMDDRRWILNLNNYRNADYFTLNNTKIAYKQLMKQQIDSLPQLRKIAVRFILHPKTKRKTDIPNVCSIHDKYFMDALVEFGKLPEDTFEYHVESDYRFGGKDAANPRVTIEIHEV